MRHIYRCHYQTNDFPIHTPSAALGEHMHETTSEEETTHQPAYKIKKPNERCTGKLQNYKIPKLTLKQDLTPKPMPSPKKQHRETLTQIEARNQPSEDQQVARLFEDILNSHLLPRDLPYTNTRRTANRPDTNSRATTKTNVPSAHRAHLTHQHWN